RVRNEPALALIGVVAAVANWIAISRGTAIPHVVDVLAAPSLFLLLEVTVLAVRRDPFWSGPTHFVGRLAEGFAAIPAALVLTQIPFFVTGFAHQSAEISCAAAIAALAFIVAD